MAETQRSGRCLKLEKSMYRTFFGRLCFSIFLLKISRNLESMTLFFLSTEEADDEEKKQIRRRSIAVIDENFETFVKTSIPNLLAIMKRYFRRQNRIGENIAKSTNKEGVKAAQLGMAERPDRTEILENLDAKILIIAGNMTML